MDRIQKNNFYKEAICSLAVIIVMITIIMSIMNSNKKIELTQLQANSHRQMMGYIIKTNNDKIIIIDGGTSDDTQNLVKKIKLKLKK